MSDEKDKQIIYSPPQSRVLTEWKPNRALPVVGAAAAVWITRQILLFARDYFRSRAIEVTAANTIEQIDKPEAHHPTQEKQTQSKPTRRITYRAYAEWTIHQDE